MTATETLAEQEKRAADYFASLTYRNSQLRADCVTYAPGLHSGGGIGCGGAGVGANDGGGPV